MYCQYTCILEKVPPMLPLSLSLPPPSLRAEVMDEARNSSRPLIWLS